MFLVSKKKEILSWLLHIAIAVIVGFLIVTFIIQRTVVHQSSMEPTLIQGENLLVEKVGVRLGILNRGDIVIIKNLVETSDDAMKTLVKRVVAMEGEELEIKDGKVYVNGQALEEEYLHGDYTAGENPAYTKLTIPEGHVYVLGDNRFVSKDSRTFGPVPLSKIEGRAILRIYPFSRFGGIE